MGHSHKQHWESGPRGTTNQSIPGHVDRKLAPIGWPPPECLKGYNRDCIKRTRGWTRIYSILNDTPGP